MIQEILKELEETWGYTTEELNDIREKMAQYAFFAVSDSDIRQEAMQNLPVECCFGSCCCAHGATCPTCDK